jgi:hypothetical protein
MNVVGEGKILLCDFNAASGLSGTLRVILESSLCANIESVEIRRSAFGGSDLARLVAQVNPDVTFLVLSPAFSFRCAASDAGPCSHRRQWWLATRVIFVAGDLHSVAALGTSQKTRSR